MATNYFRVFLAGRWDVFTFNDFDGLDALRAYKEAAELKARWGDHARIVLYRGFLHGFDIPPLALVGVNS